MCMERTVSVSYTHLAGSLTKDTSFANINEDNVIGFVGGVDSPVINDFLYGYILGAQSVNPDVKIDTRYVGNYIDPAKGKELAESKMCIRDRL